MAGSGQSGPICQFFHFLVVEDGTMCRMPSPLPGPLLLDQKSSPSTLSSPHTSSPGNSSSYSSSSATSTSHGSSSHDPSTPSFPNLSLQNLFSHGSSSHSNALGAALSAATSPSSRAGHSASSTSKTSSFASETHKNFVGRSVDRGDCISFVQRAAGAPHINDWKQGEKVQGNAKLKPGSAIATFQNGVFSNSVNGGSHSAIYLGQTKDGIQVLDQWINKDKTKRPVSQRTIYFNRPSAPNTPPYRGEDFYVVTK